MFEITSGKGFSMSFKNGWSISVQWGPGNYCQHYGAGDYDAPKKSDSWKSVNAEIALRHPSGDLYYMEEWGNSVQGRLSPDEVLMWMNKVAAFPKDKKMVHYPSCVEAKGD